MKPLTIYCSCNCYFIGQYPKYGPLIYRYREIVSVLLSSLPITPMETIPLLFCARGDLLVVAICACKRWGIDVSGTADRIILLQLLSLSHSLCVSLSTPRSTSVSVSSGAKTLSFASRLLLNASLFLVSKGPHVAK